MSKLPKWIWVLVVASALILPMLGSFGLWDPAEIRYADIAQEVAQKNAYLDVTDHGRLRPPSVLYVWLVALGFETGIDELAGRLPLAICALLTLLVGYRVVRRLAGEDAGLAAAFVLGTTPSFLFQARQLVSEMPLYLAQLAAIGGFAAYVWPADRQRRLLDLGLGTAGLIAGFVAHGLLLGCALPLFCLLLGVGLAWRVYDEPAGEPVGPEASTLGQSVRQTWRPLALALGVAGLGIWGLFSAMRVEASPLLSQMLIYGGVINKVNTPPTFDVALRDLGFASFPWFALLPPALGSFAMAQRDPGRRGRRAFVQLLVIVAAVIGYLVAVVWPSYLGELRFPTLPWLMIGVGAWGWWTYQRGASKPMWGVAAAAIILVVHQDYYARPQSLAFAHLLSTPRYPEEFSIRPEVRLFGVAFAVLFYLTLSGPPQPIQTRLRVRWIGGLLSFFARLLDRIGAGARWLAGEGNRRLWLATAALGLVFAGWCTLYLTTELSYHMSNKALFETYHRCKKRGQRLAQYQVSGRGAAYYNKGQVDEIHGQDELFDRLRKKERAFVLIPAGQLGAIDRAARQQKLPYYVLDDRNSKYLIISNKLAGSCDQDLNPLRRLVLSKRPKPQHPMHANFENRVELIGYDLPDVVTRGGKFPIKLYFHVTGQVPAGYKIFLHFDQPASRFHGDHEPLDGKYPTQYWLPGDYIIDPHEVDIPLLTTPSGTYTIYMGFWIGSKRLKVVDGPQDGHNRVRMGTLRVR